MILVDPLFNAEGLYHGQTAGHARHVGSRNGNLWCHMVSLENDMAELDAFAVHIGLKTRWRDLDHYDLTPGKRLLAIRAGAVEISKEQMTGITRWHRFGHARPAWVDDLVMTGQNPATTHQPTLL